MRVYTYIRAVRLYRNETICCSARIKKNVGARASPSPTLYITRPVDIRRLTKLRGALFLERRERNHLLETLKLPTRRCNHISDRDVKAAHQTILFSRSIRRRRTSRKIRACHFLAPLCFKRPTRGKPIARDRTKCKFLTNRCVASQIRWLVSSGSTD